MAVDLIDRERLARAEGHWRACSLCEHRCAIDRVAGERGPCKAGTEARVFRHRVELGEETQLVPSHLFYLSGCDLRCAFCIAESNAFNPLSGTELTTEFLATAVAWGRKRGARNIQWVGGEPTIHLPSILAAMSACPDLPPIVWKSDFYGTPAAFDLLKDVVDVYVADFKFGNDECAKRLAKVDRYVLTVTRNLAAVARHSDLIVRHLLLPGHFDCCYRPVVERISRELPGVKFSLRDGYLPRWQAKHYGELAHPLDKAVAARAFKFAESRGINLVR
jgi:putative pyruvate formate lyase activating enzyme